MLVKNILRVLSRSYSDYFSAIRSISPAYNPYPNPHNKKAIEELNNYSLRLLSSLTQLILDPYHRIKFDPLNPTKFSGRVAVLANYHQAFLNIEKNLLENPLELPENKTTFLYIKSEEEKAKGGAVLAFKDGLVVGRLFIADAPSFHHLTLLNSSSKVSENEQNLLKLEMLLLYFDSHNNKQTIFQTSCIGDYQYFLRKLAWLLIKNAKEQRLCSFQPLDDDEEIYGFRKDENHLFLNRNFNYNDLKTICEMANKILTKESEEEKSPSNKLKLTNPELKKLTNPELTTTSKC